MTTTAELLGGSEFEPPFDIVRAAYVELRVTDLEASEQFYAERLGLIVSARTSDSIYLRGWDEAVHHSIVLRQGVEAAASVIAFRVRSDHDLEAIEHEFDRRGCVTRWVDGEHVGMGRALRVWDSHSFPLEFFAEIEPAEARRQQFHLQRGAPIMRLDHFNLHTPNVEATVTQWLDLGFRCSEYISTDGEHETLTGAWLLRKPSVHDVAFTLGRGPRLHHVGLFVADAVGVLRACDHLAAAGDARAIERGPGRHGVSNAFFVYLRDPDGHRIELYTCDYYTGDPDHRPLRWSVSDPSCRSFYGTPAPDSWYDESSVLLGPDGAPIPTTAPAIDERTARSPLMA